MLSDLCHFSKWFGCFYWSLANRDQGYMWTLMCYWSQLLLSYSHINYIVASSIDWKIIIFEKWKCFIVMSLLAKQIGLSSLNHKHTSVGLLSNILPQNICIIHLFISVTYICGYTKYNRQFRKWPIWFASLMALQSL